VIPLETLRSEPYSLVQGNSVVAKVTATNAFGNSIESDSGNGAEIKLVPSAPLQLSNNVQVTNSQIVGLSWA